jgi:hypothetical protein
MRLDVSYNLCSKLGSRLIFWRNYGNFSFTRPFPDFDRIFLSDLFFKVGHNKIYECLGEEAGKISSVHASGCISKSAVFARASLGLVLAVGCMEDGQGGPNFGKSCAGGS